MPLQLIQHKFFGDVYVTDGQTATTELHYSDWQGDDGQPRPDLDLSAFELEHDLIEYDPTYFTVLLSQDGF